jgi:DNA-binding transcriptional regulator YdaS (Cro superfamily)
MKRTYKRGGGPIRRRTISKALALVFKHYGGAIPIAARLGVTRQAVNKWRTVPVEHVLTIERDTDGTIRAYQLAPKIYPRWLATWPRPARRELEASA